MTPNGGWGESNTALIAGNGESLLVDTLWDLPRTSAMLAAFKSYLEAAPLSRVVNTHADGDHWFGNQLTGPGVEIIATKAAQRHMQRHGPRQMKALRAAARAYRVLGCLPVPGRTGYRVAAEYFAGMTRAFDFSKIRPAPANSNFTGKMQLQVGGRQVVLVEVGPAHTSGDLVVHLPEERIVVAGDILFVGVLPILWDGSARNWTRACERILEWKVDTVIPGHGPVTDLSGVDIVRKYWQFLRGAVQRHFDKGRSPDWVARHILNSDEYQKQPFASWDGQERTVVNVHSMYRRLMGLKRQISPFERLNLLRKTALLARDLPHRSAELSLGSDA